MGDWELKLFPMNEEFPVSVGHKLALIKSLFFVHTARRYYRLDGLGSRPCSRGHRQTPPTVGRLPAQAGGHFPIANLRLPSPPRTHAGGWVRTALRHKGRSPFHRLVSSVDRSVIGEGSHTRSGPAAWRHRVVGSSRQTEGFGVLSSHGKRSR
ncbi:hypothetical protein chiPu_0022654 [Chiloscyllium punctatum]|uniref:Uncharacterized protein n=1 Tax=Chiloscyllium punctatum TaxID=137246 RepID=A0A401RJB0_CHIPU|nr:hypothetical protein [Chiloscyllium punctatum]